MSNDETTRPMRRFKETQQVSAGLSPPDTPDQENKQQKISVISRLFKELPVQHIQMRLKLVFPVRWASAGHELGGVGVGARMGNPEEYRWGGDSHRKHAGRVKLCPHEPCMEPINAPHPPL